MRGIFCAVTVAALLAISSASPANDWPGWRGEKRDAHVPDGVAVPEQLPKEAKIIWHQPVADGFASPVVAGGNVFLLDFIDGKEAVRALNAADGKQLWSVPLDASHKDGFGTGPRCTPVVDVAAKKVYAQSTRGELQCLDAADGKLVWHKNFGTDFGQVFIGEKGDAAGAQRHGNAGSPLIDGEHLIVLPGGKDAAVVCLDKNTGALVWKSQDDMTGYAPAVMLELAGQRQVVVFTAIALIGLNPTDGNLLWRLPLKTRLGRHVTTPVAIGADMVSVASHQLGLLGIKISKNGENFKAEQLWENKEAAFNFASPVVVGNYIYGIGTASKLMCVDALKGEIVWGQTGVVKTSMDKAFAGILVMGKNLLILTDTGELVMCAADPKEYREISRLQVCGSNWCVPAYADGRLYIREKSDANAKKSGAAEKREVLCVEVLK